MHILTITISTSKYSQGDQYLDWRVENVFLRVSKLCERRLELRFRFNLMEPYQNLRFSKSTYKCKTTCKRGDPPSKRTTVFYAVHVCKRGSICFVLGGFIASNDKSTVCRKLAAYINISREYSSLILATELNDKQCQSI